MSTREDQARTNVTVLGTGAMGGPIARNLLRAGFPVSVWNRTPEAAAPLADAGAALASSPAAAVDGADVVITMVADGEAVTQTMTGSTGALETLRPGSVWIQMGTIGVEWTDRFATLAAAHGIEFVDAPVSGSDAPAREGTLIVLVSGPEETRARLQPIFDVIGRKTIWLGPAGNGSRLKLVLNNWLAVQVEGMAETIALTQALGLDSHLFLEAIDGEPLGSPYAVAKGRAMITHEYAAGFAMRLGLKDVRLGLDAARERNLELPITAAVAQRFEKAIADGHADEDVASVFAEANAYASTAVSGAMKDVMSSPSAYRCRDLLSSSADWVRAGFETVELEEAPSDDRNGT
jgi:3-hydroxyisobutyrate dehydrogenase